MEIRECWWKVGSIAEMSGRFHAWGMDALESNDGNIMWSVAICEDKSGNVYKVPVEKVRFYKY